MSLVIPHEPYASDHLQLLALCIWREARGEPIEGKYGVGWTIQNRCMLAPAQGFKDDWKSNILKPWAFSSFMDGDPNAVKYPAPTDPSWLDCLKVADSMASVEKWTHADLIPTADVTQGAVFYYSLPLKQPPKAWGSVEHSATIGNLQFYRIKT